MKKNASNIFTVNLPDIGEGVVEGEVIQWLKNIGDDLQQDEPVVIVMTDKATVELPAPYPGTLQKQYFKPGETAIKDKPLYDIALKDSAPKPQKEVKQPLTKQKRPAVKEKSETPALPKQQNGAKALATPATRKLARDLGIDINSVHGSGPDGRVTKADLAPGKRTSPPSIPRFKGDTVEKVAGIPKLMAEKMAESKRTAAHFSYFEQVDATRLVTIKQRIKGDAEGEGIHLTYMPFIIRALSLSLKKYPKVNSAYDESSSSLVLHKQQNIGIAIASELGLIVPVLHNVQEMNLEEIIKSYETIKQDALNHKLQSKDMKGATITLSNFGVLTGGGMWATPVINTPEVAILAVSRIQKQPMVRNGELVVRDALNLSWSFDHRVIDGDLASHFSHHFASLLQNPATLL